jgi:hypothetical protein
MKEESFWVLMGDAYDGLKEAGEAVTIKAGRAAYYWFYRHCPGVTRRAVLHPHACPATPPQARRYF